MTIRDSLAQVQELPAEDVEKAVAVLRVLHEGSAEDMEKAGNFALAEVHRDAVRLLDYTLALHRQNISVTDAQEQDCRKLVDDLRSILEHGNELEEMRVPSNDVSAYMTQKRTWKERCATFLRDHGQELMKMLEERDE